MSRIISRKPDNFRIVPHAFDGMVGGLAAVSRIIAAPLRGAWVRHRDGCRLQELSDYQLRDIGIQRGQIDDVVRYGHY